MPPGKLRRIAWVSPASTALGLRPVRHSFGHLQVPEELKQFAGGLNRPGTVSNSITLANARMIARRIEEINKLSY
jgi:hypothetical protein